MTEILKPRYAVGTTADGRHRYILNLNNADGEPMQARVWYRDEDGDLRKHDFLMCCREHAGVAARNAIATLRGDMRAKSVNEMMIESIENGTARIVTEDGDLAPPAVLAQLVDDLRSGRASPGGGFLNNSTLPSGDVMDNVRAAAARIYEANRERPPAKKGNETVH